MSSVFRSTANNLGLFQVGDVVVVAVSGGPDSVALLHLLCEWREIHSLGLHVAHFDHGVRGAESVKDALFVENLARDLGLPFHLGRGDVSSFKREHGLSPEEACRELRFRFLRETAVASGAQKVALGHTADDQAEELLLRLIRGSGTRGLSGMAFLREGIFVRPLLNASRKDIISFLVARNLSFRKDASNDAQEFLRNRIRHNLLPLLERDFNPRIKESLVRTASIVRSDDAFLNEVTEETWARVARRDGAHGTGGVVVDLKAFGEVPRAIQMRLLRKGLELSGSRMKEIGFRHLESVQRLAGGSGAYRRISLPGGVWVERSYQQLRFYKRLPVELTGFWHTVDCPGTLLLPEFGYSITFEVIGRSELPGSFGLSNGHRVSYFDYKQARFPLVVRSLRPGDRFRPSGMGGSQKIKDYFINAKIPRPVRHTVPVVVQGNRVVGIVGWRTDDAAIVTEETKQILKISLD